MEAELVIWFLYAALFLLLFLLSAIRYHHNPKVSCQLALFSLLFSVTTLLTAVGRVIHGDTTVDGYVSWLYNLPPPMQFAFPCLSIIIYNAIFDAQRQFFEFYAVVLSNYGRWSALHMNPRISKLSSTMDLGSNNTTHMNPISLWLWFNILLLVIFGFTVISLLCCQFILSNPEQIDQLLLSKAICVSVLSFCVILNLVSSMYTRYKLNLRYSLTTHPPKEERAGFKYATSTSSSALVPKDKSKRSLLVLILTPICFLASSVAVTFEMWIIYGAMTRSMTLSPSLSATISILDLIIECLFVCLPITFLILLNVFYVKPYPFIIEAHNIKFLP